MMNYLIEASICLLSFYLLYFLFLRNNKFFNWQRAFLLAGLIGSVLIPLVDVGTYEPAAMQVPVVNEALTYLKMPRNTALPEKAFDWSSMLLYIYMAGVCVFTVRLMIVIGKLVSMINKSKAEKSGRFTLLYTNKPVFAASFFNYIFIENSIVNGDESYRYMLLHEKKHALDYHFLDIILIELFKIMFWFNPVIYRIGESLRSVHEFICDEEVVKHITTRKYEKLLIKSFFTQVGVPLLSQFNETSIKNRLIMMNKQKSTWLKKLKFLAIVPLMLLLIYACNNEEFGENEALSTELSGVITDKSGNPLPGVNVVLDGTQVGSVTNFQGQYKLDNSKAKATKVTYSFIGMESVTEQIGSRTVIDVSLAESDEPVSADNTFVSPSDFTYDKGKKVKGKVTDSNGNTLSGITITLPGTSIKVKSDSNGDYEVAVPDEGGFLLFSYDDFNKYVVKVDDKSVLDVVMKKKELESSEY
ncbi:MAG: carboxypeptidase-like regulatory domain-containing protein [Cyclobacteriaceae bacterium]